MPPTPPRPFRAGVNWMPARNKLYRFDALGVTVVRPWPDPRAWRKDEDRGWRSTVPDVEVRAADPAPPPLGWPHVFEQDAWAVVPSHVRDLVVRASFSGRQWQALNLAHRAPHARTLMQEVPLLAAALADQNWLRSLQGRPRLTRPWRSARALAPRALGWKGWVWLAGRLGLPAERPFVRVLRQAGPLTDQSWSPHELQMLAAAWTHPPARKLLLHLPRVTPALVLLLSVATRDAAVLGALAFRLLADAQTPTAQNNLMQMVVSFVLLRGHVVAPPPVPPLATLEQVERARDRVADLIGTVPVDPVAPFPPPPVPGTDRIRPLQSPAALAAEGAVMSHCIGDGGYAHLAAIGLGYGYAVTVQRADETHRGSVWIAPHPNKRGLYRVEQLQGPGNTEPNPGVREAVAAWMGAHTRTWEEQVAGATRGGAVETMDAGPAPWLAAFAPRPLARQREDAIPF